MTDNEIIKALEEHIERTKNIKYGARKMAIVDVGLLKDTLDLINRQKAENEALKTENKQLQSDVIIEKQNYEHIKELLEIEKATVKRANERFFKAKKDLQEANAEIERLVQNLNEAFEEIEALKHI